MLTCGLKLTHDGGVAVLDGNVLKLCVEAEKVGQRHRHAALGDARTVVAALAASGLTPDEIGEFTVDGWGARRIEDRALAELEAREWTTTVGWSDHGAARELRVARYRERAPDDDLLQTWNFDGLSIAGRGYRYRSALHVTGHVLSAYCTSPFATAREPAVVLVWDGGTYPTLYRVDPGVRSVKRLGMLFRLFGSAYARFASQFPPFDAVQGDELSIAGKVMAFIATGVPQRQLVRYIKAASSANTLQFDFPNRLANLSIDRFRDQSVAPADLMAAFYVYLEELLCATLEDNARAGLFTDRNLCLAGGCALNIKWNSAIRALGIFESTYVPPFPNDSGSAIGTACVSLFRRGVPNLIWSVFSGPELCRARLLPGWTRRPCDVSMLAALLHESGEPVIFLNGRAEIGPRALGARSILAPATYKGMKALLNRIKNREPYRPVAPICAERDASLVFDPGTADPYMLFDHQVLPAWMERIPAVVHLDRTSRLQTVSRSSNVDLHALLERYRSLSGIPVLCNTSANENGHGFFDGAEAAMRWGRLNYVFADGELFSRDRLLSFPELEDADA